MPFQGMLFSKIFILFISTDPRADVNSLLSDVTQKMCEKYHFYHTCLQVEIPRTGHRTNFHPNNATENAEHNNTD